MNAITYHPDFNKYDLGLDHPLIGNKPQEVMEMLHTRKLLQEFDIITPASATDEEILRVHGNSYVNQIKKLSETGGLLSFDTPVPKGIYQYATLAAGGTLACCSKVCETYTIAVNPLGGFHHASINHSSGFCFFNDIAIGIEFLRDHHHLKKFLIIDLDVHHGNGTQDIYFRDSSVMNLSLHQDGHTLYPGTGALETIGDGEGTGYTINFPLPPRTGNDAYLYAFNEIVPPLTMAFQPEVILYQSGVDTHHSDPLADLMLTYQAYYHIARTIAHLSNMTCKKLIVLLGGGYNSNTCISAYENVFNGLLGKSTYLTEPDVCMENNLATVKKDIRKLKEILKPHWKLP